MTFSVSLSFYTYISPGRQIESYLACLHLNICSSHVSFAHYFNNSVYALTMALATFSGLLLFAHNCLRAYLHTTRCCICSLTACSGPAWQRGAAGGGASGSLWRGVVCGGGKPWQNSARQRFGGTVVPAPPSLQYSAISNQYLCDFDHRTLSSGASGGAS